MPLTDQQVWDVIAAAKVASAGPWSVVGNTLYLCDQKTCGHKTHQESMDWFAFLGNRETANFCQKAREVLPELAEEVLTLREALRKTRPEFATVFLSTLADACRQHHVKEHRGESFTMELPPEMVRKIVEYL